MAGPRFLSIGKIMNSSDCLNSFSVIFWFGVRLEKVWGRRLFDLIVSFKVFSKSVSLSSVIGRAGGGFPFLSLMYNCGIYSWLFILSVVCR